MYSPLQIAQASGQPTYNWGKSTTKENQNIYRNWTKALEETVRHVCTTAEKIKENPVAFVKNINWKGVLKTSAYIAGEFFSVNDIYRVITGTDPLTGEKPVI